MTAQELPNFHHLRAFSLTAHLRSVHGAARQAHLSQPAVTQAIGRLEKRFDCRFFERRSTGMYPTPLGEIMLLRVDRALDLLDGAARRIGESARRNARARPAPLDRMATTTQLRALIAISQTGSFSAAARAIDQAQPSVHRAGRDLEKLAGVPLFERISHGVALTPHGRLLAMRASLAFKEIEAAGEDLEAAKGVVRGRLIIGTLPLVRTELVPAALAGMTGAYPDAEISVIDGPYDGQLTALRTGEIDMLIGALREPAPADDVEERALFFDTLSVIARRGHPLAGRTTIGIDDLRRYGWVVPRASTPTREHFDALMRTGNEAPPPGLIVTSSLVVLRGLLLKSDRLAILSRRQVTYEERTGLLTALPVALNDPPRPIGLTLRRNWHPTRLQSAFIAALEDAVAREEQPI
ncbi:LysR family transcriptional regulator [Breoghania sp. L-A4]|uniref:LysR family transcriptional regulator n=1 Tax=Breoghania sp. L-A4 TaxID=2304600 RepID=UPI000E35FE98|nr:LysR family transcriptional regulator [Breoghania sp. L-A4]AXS38882.1 LysR family transcriptional regulator [Breoghania sp. L-A4]